ncbi:hypothetical protein J2X11_001663 [Aeromicrobium panaciterrae]|uniref:Uncharacterized protein n=1 Tax=Aeromicrobium panaciterrae TaxID=363861 RepID=A0ABU1UNU2_9ACTN|nr:hypothetical protein [Aeromicrobium panaciterrae]MDR7086824.1 hypothetical protein [Aeromicrobium panaciterrae]
MDDQANESVIGRLLEEISWQKAAKYRQGGRGIEDVLTAEVFMPLDYLPRDLFLGEVFRRGHGANHARAAIVSEIEDAQFTLLPDEVLVGPKSIKVQPDGCLATPSTLVLIEAKRIRRSSFQTKQLARELVALHQQSDGRTPLLFLVLSAPPPVLVDNLGRIDLVQAISLTIDEVLAETGLIEFDASGLLHDLEDTLAWITWSEIRQLVEDQVANLPDLSPGLAGTIRRLAAAVTGAVDWHT